MIKFDVSLSLCERSNIDFRAHFGAGLELIFTIISILVQVWSSKLSQIEIELNFYVSWYLIQHPTRLLKHPHFAKKYFSIDFIHLGSVWGFEIITERKKIGATLKVGTEQLAEKMAERCYTTMNPQGYSFLEKYNNPHPRNLILTAEQLAELDFHRGTTRGTRFWLRNNRRN